MLNWPVARDKTNDKTNGRTNQDTSFLERELKFSLLDDTFPPLEDLKAVFKLKQWTLEPPATVQIHDIYYDTPNQALATASLALRQRTENGTRYVTLKAPQTPHTITHEHTVGDSMPKHLLMMDEWEVPLVHSIHDGLPAEISAVLAEKVPYIDRTDLTPLAQLNIHRVTYAISRLGRALALLCFDDVSVVRDMQDVSAHFLEVEIEAIGKTTNAKLVQFSQQLALAADIVPCHTDKLQRSLVLLDLTDTLNQGF